MATNSICSLYIFFLIPMYEVYKTCKENLSKSYLLFNEGYYKKNNILKSDI